MLYDMLYARCSKPRPSWNPRRNQAPRCGSARRCCHEFELSRLVIVSSACRNTIEISPGGCPVLPGSPPGPLQGTMPPTHRPHSRSQQPCRRMEEDTCVPSLHIARVCASRIVHRPTPVAAWRRARGHPGDRHIPVDRGQSTRVARRHRRGSLRGFRSGERPQPSIYVQFDAHPLLGRLLDRLGSTIGCCIGGLPGTSAVSGMVSGSAALLILGAGTV